LQLLFQKWSSEGHTQSHCKCGTVCEMVQSGVGICYRPLIQSDMWPIKYRQYGWPWKSFT